MSGKERICAGITRTAGGYFFLYFDLTIGAVDLLPAFVGMLFFLSAIDLMKEQRRDLELLRPFAVVLTAWYFVDWAAAWIGKSPGEILPMAELLVSLAGMYFHFQLLTDLAAVARMYDTQDPPAEEKILRWRTLQTVMLTGILIVSCLLDWLHVERPELVILLSVIYLIAGICIMRVLFVLRSRI